MTAVKIVTNFSHASALMKQTIQSRLGEVTANALNNTAFEARAAVQKEMRRVFRDPEPLTLSSVSVLKVDATKGSDEQFALVFIRDDYPKATTQPGKYLLAEEKGGARGLKRSERALASRGVLLPGQQLTPGSGAPLDSHKQISGAGMTLILSRARGLQEVGSQGNATDATTLRIIQAARRKAALASKRSGGSKDDVRNARKSAFLPIHKASGTDFFVMKSRRGSGSAGVFQLVGRGKVQPVLWFTKKAAAYSPRFPFRSIVSQAASEQMNRQLVRALRFIAGRK